MLVGQKCVLFVCLSIPTQQKLNKVTNKVSFGLEYRFFNQCKMPLLYQFANGTETITLSIMKKWR